MSFKIPCGGFKIDDDTLKLKEDGTLYAAGGGIQPDWNQNDSTASDYIKNRPFYAEELPYISLDADDVEGAIVLYKVSSDIPSISNPQVGDTITIWDNGVKGDSHIFASAETGYVTSEFMCGVAFQDNATIEIYGVSFVLPERGTYFAKAKISGVTITGVAKRGASTPEISWDGNTATIKKLDEKFIPDMDSVILNSSTADSTKKFKITVDDSGAISATEVTT